MMSQKCYSVSQVNRYIKNTLDKDAVLSAIFVHGEVSNYKKHTSNHLYFNLKDENTTIKCVMFKTSSTAIDFEIENGMKIVCFGYVSSYEKSGSYQLYVELAEPVGLGDIYVEFEKLKTKLSNDGLFDEKYKQEIPTNPETIAVITSPTGAAVRDIINVIKRRNKSVKIILIPTLVQGDGAPAEIINAIETANELHIGDVIILGRGGGSMEDLWCFNDEKVAHAIFNSKIPIISGVGHEVDFTISDFVADIRAATPSAAAEIATSVSKDIENYLYTVTKNLNLQLENKLGDSKTRLKNINKHAFFRKPLQNVHDKQVYIENLSACLSKAINKNLNAKKNILSHKIDLLNSVSPLNVIKRGFAVTLNEENKVITKISDVKKNDVINIKISDGTITAGVSHTSEEKVL